MNIRADLPPHVVRRSIEDEIERLIAMLDGIDPDPDLEPTGDDEPSLGWQNDYHGAVDQSHQALAPTGFGQSDECEEENEHGGDIQDEPHDDKDQGDDEHTLGWAETYGQAGVGTSEWGPSFDYDNGMGGLSFRGDGNEEARRMLRPLHGFLRGSR